MLNTDCRLHIQQCSALLNVCFFSQKTDVHIHFFNELLLRPNEDSRVYQMFDRHLTLVFAHEAAWSVSVMIIDVLSYQLRINIAQIQDFV